MVEKLFCLIVLVALVACNPVNQPNPDKDSQVVDSVSISDPKLLIGEWSYSNNSKQYIEINDSLIIEYYSKVLVNRYTVQGTTLLVERLNFPIDDSCYLCDTCAYRLVCDTLYIENFKLSPLATWPPTFFDVKLIRMHK